MTNCIFCEIVKGEIPAYKVYESENSFAFLDIKPHAKGHTVVIPKKHAGTIFDLNDLECKKLMRDVRKVMLKLKEVLHTDGFNTGWNHNTAGGQVVPHLHIHIMPRYDDDGGGNMHSIISNPGDMRVNEVATLFN